MMLRLWIRNLETSERLSVYWTFTLINYLYKSPLFGIIYFFFNFFYSYIISYKLFGVSLLPRVCFSNGLFRIVIQRRVGSKIKFNNRQIVVIFEKWMSGSTTVISVGRDAELLFDNTFVIGDGCKLEVGRGGRLIFFGKDNMQKSGITCNSLILCAKYISIGAGTIISWGCYITDCSQHKINGNMKIVPVVIGNNVWINENVSCVPGGEVGNGSIVGAKSYVNKVFPDAVFLAGTPARIIGENVNWCR